MNTNSAVAVALLVDGESRLVAVLVKVPYAQAAGSSQAHASVEIGLENGAVAVVEHAVAGGEAHELARASSSEGAGAFDRIGRFAGDKLGMGGIGHVDGQAELGGGAGQVFVKARERGDAAVEGLGRLLLFPHGVTPALHVGDRG